jgi:uncharacterized protein (DUF342 family)
LSDEKPVEQDNYDKAIRRVGPLGQTDASMDLRVADDKMSAEADFYPARHGGQLLSRDYVEDSLRNAKVIAGVDWDKVSECINTCNLDGKNLLACPIARGETPTSEQPEHFVLDEALSAQGVKPDSRSLHIDYKKISPFLMIEAGSKIGRIEPRVAGKNGFDVEGKVLPFPTKTAVSVELGQNVSQRGADIFAEKSGRVVMVNERKISVEEVLEIKGNVDYHTGHVVFPGSVILDGDIDDGFKVYSGASILCKTSVDASDINAKGDLIVQGGLIGRQSAHVKVGGELQAKFAQNCRLAVKGNAKIAGAIVGSRLYCLGKLDMGDKGQISGEEIWAIHGVKAARVGTVSGKKVLIRIGLDFIVQQQIDLILERLKVLALKQEKAKVLNQKKASSALGALINEIVAMQHRLEAELANLYPKLEADPSATLEVTERIFPGVTLTICRVSIEVEKPLKRVSFKLDPVSNKIEVVPLK